MFLKCWLLGPGTVPVPGQQKARAQNTGDAGCCSPHVFGGSRSAPQGFQPHIPSLGSHQVDRRTAAHRTAEHRGTGTCQGYFSPSAQASILQMTHFLHLLPITLQLAQPPRLSEHRAGQDVTARAGDLVAEDREDPAPLHQLHQVPTLGSSHWAASASPQLPAEPELSLLLCLQLPLPKGIHRDNAFS